MKISYGRHSITKDDIISVSKTLRSGWLTQGPQLENFEKALARYCGAKYAVAVCNGTAALHLAYLAAGLKAGDEVITTPNTFVATANMLLAVGVTPVFCDIRADTYNIDEKKVEDLINKNTKALVPVHFGGQPCEMEKLQGIAGRYHLLTVEDACHALGAGYKKNKIGSCKYSDLAVFSFHPVKSITTGEGGAILTNNKAYYEKLKLLRSHGVMKDQNGFNVMEELGYNYRLTDIQAALGLTQLKKLDKFLKIRHQLVEIYERELESVKEIILPVELSGIYSSWHLYVVRVKNVKDRIPLYKFLLKKGIRVNFHYPMVYGHPFYRQNGFQKTRCAVGDNYEKTAMTLPLHTKLTAKEVKYICKVIKLYFKKYA